MDRVLPSVADSVTENVPATHWLDPTEQLLPLASVPATDTESPIRTYARMESELPRTPESNTENTPATTAFDSADKPQEALAGPLIDTELPSRAIDLTEKELCNSTCFAIDPVVMT